MKKNLFRYMAIFLSAIVISSGFTQATFAKVKQKATQVKAPEIKAKSAVVYCENTGEVIFEKNAHERCNPYSTTKIMTALLASQKLQLDREVTVSKAASDIGESTMDLNEGEIVTVEQLLYGLLLPSGNDAAYALGETVSGDIESFAALMNETAVNIGCKNTHFVNPNGLKADGHYSSAYDMMQIFKVAMSSDVVRKIAGTETYTVPATNNHAERNLENTCKLLKEKGTGVVAAKTGSWADENSIVFRYEKNGLRFCIAIMQSGLKTREDDARLLIAYGEEAVKGVKVVKSGKAVGKVAIKGGVKTRLDAYTSADGIAYVPKGGSEKLISTRVDMSDKVKAPVKAGDVVGKYVILVADEPVNEVPLVIKESVNRGWFPSQIGISNLATVLICSGLIILSGLWIYISAKRAKIKRRKERARKMKIMELARRQVEEEENRRRRGWNF